ncbi:hypothetical protein M758_2G244000, partial [Ceratodon purpureus]
MTHITHSNIGKCGTSYKLSPSLRLFLSAAVCSIIKTPLFVLHFAVILYGCAFGCLGFFTNVCTMNVFLIRTANYGTDRVLIRTIVKLLAVCKDLASLF